MLRTILATLTLVIFVPRAVLAHNDPPRPDLRGIVTAAPDGSPVENATVIMWTAGVKQGYSTMCPSCWPDCGKRANTDAEGRFLISDLDPDLLFRIVIVADGFRPTFVSKVDPSAGPIAAPIEPRPLPEPESRSALRGRVVNAEGKPLRFAVVTPRMMRFPNGGGRGGAVPGLDPVAVTDADGRFILCYKEDFATLDVDAHARGYATSRVNNLAPGATVHTITLHEGAAITGRVVKDGKPVPGVLVGTAQLNRDSNVYLGEVTIGTDDEGRFALVNIPIAPSTHLISGASPQLWNVYAKMESIKHLGASPFIPVTVAKDRELYTVGDIELRPGLAFSGRVILSDGAQIPEGMSITAATESAWDAQTVPLAPDGVFRFTNLPRDEYSVFPAIKGYFLSPKNPSLSWSLEGRLDADLSDFLILMEPGEETFDGLAAGKHRGQPLRSIPISDLPSPPK